jgi:hypothetical protein
MFDYTMEHVFSYTATLRAPPEVIGPVPEGVRVNFYVTGGQVTGPRLQGIVRPVGADWLTLRTDGMGVLDVRATIETHDGALIDVAYHGLGDLGPDGYAQFLAGKAPERVDLTTTPRIRCAHPDYAWLHRSHFIGIGQVNLQAFTVAYDVYALRR